ncbi:MAG: phosphotransferase [Rhodoferax sp.]|nr:phosphotransferase [Rhodoferax sp.]
MSTLSTPSRPLPTPAPVLWSDPERQRQFQSWLASIQVHFALQPETLRLASADASFRRYLRIDTQRGAHAESLIIMDAPPDKENSAPFVKVAQLLHDAAIRAPEVLDWQQEQGFLLLSDLGAQTMMQVIDPAAPPPLNLYLQAVDTLIAWQKASRPGVLPPYDHALLRRELELFPQWYIGQHRQWALDEAQRKVLDTAFETIIAENLAWPQVYVHRDFMPRNLMAPMLVAARTALPPEGALQNSSQLGVLDFQDAVFGPITYDIASLVRDAFLSWDEDFCLDVVVRYWQKAREAGLPVGDDFGVFYRAVEWMGLQRHLKIAGIFARLSLRDGKAHYLADTPRFITYIRATCGRYRELKPLLRLIDKMEGIEEPNVFGFGRSPGAA